MTARLVQSCKWVLLAMVLCIAGEALPGRLGNIFDLIFLVCWLASIPLGIIALMLARRSVTEVLTWPAILLLTSTALLVFCLVFSRALIL
jgi:hypothetical protein